MGSKINDNGLKDFPNNEMDRCKISEWEVVLGALTYMTPVSVKMTNNLHGTKTI